GGWRTPVLEQGKEWWKVGGPKGRTGWVRLADVEPHASFVLIDAATGRVQRRIAAKGQRGAVSDGKLLWSISDTGITRTQVGDTVRIWSNGIAGDRDASMPWSSRWSSDLHRFALLFPGERS